LLENDPKHTKQAWLSVVLLKLSAVKIFKITKCGSAVEDIPVYGTGAQNAAARDTENPFANNELHVSILMIIKRPLINFLVETYYRTT